MEKVKISPARFCAYKVLFDVIHNGAFSNISLSTQTRAMNLSPDDASLCRAIVYGSVKKYNYLMYIVSLLSKTPMNMISSNVKVILAMSIWQIENLQRVPDYAVVSDAVEIVKMQNVPPRTSGFVNGLLRSYIRKKDEFKNIQAKDTRDYMYLEYNMPGFVYDTLLQQYSEKQIKDFFLLATEPAQVFVAVNVYKTTKENLKETLIKEGVEVFDTLQEGVLRILPKGNLTKLNSFRDSLFFVMDIASFTVAKALGAKEGSLVLDCCAAPGSKSMVIASYMKNKGEVISSDIKKNKLPLIEAAAKNAGLTIISPKKRDACVYNETWEDRFDYILCDVPCSGLGVVKRKPEILMHLTDEYLEYLPTLQEKILRNNIRYLKRGGTLIYSTCTINKKENMEVVKKVLDEDKTIALTPLGDALEPFLGENSAKTHIQFLDLAKSDAFFIAKIVKKL